MTDRATKARSELLRFPGASRNAIMRASRSALRIYCANIRVFLYIETTIIASAECLIYGLKLNTGSAFDKRNCGLGDFELLLDSFNYRCV